ncbi:MAG TPA: hypothetical protein PKY30_07435, partial [Myxococcota bacterium]|nr:hypothetical protein [Myxococcota bacterium]
YPSTGVATVDFLADVAIIDAVGGGAGVSLKPAMQFAATRIDRPANMGSRISNGSDITSTTRTHFQETLSAGDKFFFRRGFAYKLTGGSIARIHGTLYTAWRAKAELLPPVEIVFNPTNDTAAVSYFPLGRILPCNGVTAIKLAGHSLDNLSNTTDCRPAIRIFNDLWARGGWTDLGSWNEVSAGDNSFNSDEISLAGLDPASTTAQFLELALAVRKSTNEDPNSRCIFQVMPAVLYG